MDFLGQITQFFDNVNILFYTVYFGILACLVALFILAVFKYFMPLVWHPEIRESQHFQAKCVAVGTGFVILLILLTLPIWLPSALTFFGASGVTVNATGI